MLLIRIRNLRKALGWADLPPYNSQAFTDWAETRRASISWQEAAA